MGLLADMRRRPLKPGDAAPALQAIDQDGQPLDLTPLFREGTTLVYFYPKASTYGCTAQACSLRDNFPELTARNVRILGVSADRAAAQKRFQENQRLPFTLLADTQQEIARAFGVSSLFGFVSRQSFLIRDSTILSHFPDAKTKGHGQEVLEKLDEDPP